MEEVLGKMLAQGIEVWWPEEGDRRKGATAERAGERSSSLIDGRRREEEMTAGAHNKVNIWVLQRGSPKRAKMRHGRLCLCSIDDGSGVVATWARVC